MEAREQQKYIAQLMSRGLEKAADSFSRFINRKMLLAQSNTILIEPNKTSPYVSDEKGNLTLLTTDIIGEVSGRSYLILSDREREEICYAVSPQLRLRAEIEEAMLLEIDNIISASVIGQLANELNIEVYGDVPSLQYVKAENVQNALSCGTKHESPSGIILCNATFVLSDHHQIHPQFIWKFSTKIFDQIKHQIIPS